MLGKLSDLVEVTKLKRGHKARTRIKFSGFNGLEESRPGKSLLLKLQLP